MIDDLTEYIQKLGNSSIYKERMKQDKMLAENFVWHNVEAWFQARLDHSMEIRGKSLSKIVNNPEGYPGHED